MRKLSALLQQVLLETFTLGINSGAKALQENYQLNFDFSMSRFDILEKKFALAALASTPEQQALGLSRNFSCATGGMLLLIMNKKNNDHTLEFGEFNALGQCVLNACIKTLEYLFEQDVAASLSAPMDGSWKAQLQQCHYLTEYILVAPIHIQNKSKNHSQVAYLIFDLESMDEFQSLVSRYIDTYYSMQNSG